MPESLTEFDGAIAYANFTRPKARYARSEDMRNEMFEFLKQSNEAVSF